VAILQFEKVARRYRAQGWQQTIGSSGTARMLAKVLKANRPNDFGQDGITYGGLLRLSLLLLKVKNVQQLKLAGFAAASPEHFARRIGIDAGGVQGIRDFADGAVGTGAAPGCAAWFDEPALTDH
jgi:hypothetical protein